MTFDNSVTKADPKETDIRANTTTTTTTTTATATTNAVKSFHVADSILPPITDALREDFRLERDNRHGKNERGEEVHTRTTGGKEGHESGLVCCGMHILGVPTLMCFFLLSFSIGVIAYAILSAVRFDPLTAEDFVKPPYFSNSPTIAP